MSNVPELIASLNQTPDDPETVEALERELALAEAWTDYASMLPKRIRGLSDAVERTRFLIRAAHVCRHYGDNVDVADELLLEAVSIELLPEDLVQATHRAFAPHEDWSGLVAAYMDLAEIVDGEEHQSRLMFATGKAYEDRLYDPERAIHCYQRSFKLDPRFTEPLHHARQIYAHADQWSTVARLYQIELKVVRDAHPRARLLKELGNIQMERLGERDQAIASFREAVELDPAYSGLNDVIANLQSGSGAHGVVIDPSMMTITGGGPEVSTVEDEVEIRPVTMDVAVVVDDGETVPDDEDAAGEAADAAVVAVDDETSEQEPADDDEVAEAETSEEETAEEETAEDETAEDETAEDETAEDETAEDETAEEETAEEETAEDETAEDETAEDETAEEETAEDETAEDDVAAADRSPGEETGPAEPRVSAGPAAMGAVAGIDDYIDTLRDRALEGGEDVLDALAWAVELQLQRGDGAAEVAEFAVEALAASDDALASVRAMLPAALGRDDFWAALSEWLEAADDAPAGARYGVAFYALGDYDAAAPFAAGAGPMAALEAEVMDVARKGNWRKTHQGLTDGLAHLGDDAEREAYRAQIAIALGVGKVDKAADSARRVLRADKSDIDAQSFARALNRALERWNPVVDALKHLASAVADTDGFRERLLLREQVDLYRNELQQPAAVMQGLQRLSEADPTDLVVIDELIELLEELNNHRELVTVLRRKADAVQSDEERIAILREVATLFVERFNNQAEALSAYEQILELSPGDEEALRQLEELYERRREWEKLIDTKRQLVELTAEEAEQARLLRDAATVAATRMRDNDFAESLWDEVLSYEPQDGEALEALERLHERAKSWDKLAGVLHKRVDVLPEEEQAAALLKLGQIQGDRLGDTAGSVGTWERLLELDPENLRARESLRKAYVDLEAWDELEAFYARDEQWTEYVRQIEAIAGGHDDRDTAVQLFFRAAEVWGAQLDDELRSTKALERVLGLDETNERAARELVPVYRERGDAKRLAEVLEIRLGHDDDAGSRYETRVELARIGAERRSNDVALRWFTEALREQPHAVEIADELHAAAAAEGAWTQLRDAWETARAALEDDGTRQREWLDLSLRLGQLLHQTMDAAPAALACFDDVLEREPDNRTALDAKDAIFTQQGDWDALLEVIEAKLATTTDDGQRVALLERSCLIQEEHREDYEAAIQGYAEILETEPRHEAALLALHRLYRHAGEPHALAETLRTLVEVRTEAGLDEERRALQTELAGVYVEDLAEPERAVDVLEVVVREEPADARARQLLETLLDDEGARPRVARLLEPLYEADRAWAPLVDVLEIQLSEEADSARSASLLSRIGDAQANELGDPGAATDAYGRLLRLTPADASAQERVEAVAAATGDWEPVVSLYESLLDQLNAADETERALAVDLGTRTSAFHDEKLGDLDEAVRLLRRVLDVDGTHVPTLERLEALLTRDARWEDLLGVLGDRLNLTAEQDERRALLFKQATIQREMLDDPGAAIDAYRDVLAAFPEDTDALEALDTLYGATADSASRADVLEQRVRLADAGSTEQLALQNRLALIYEDELGEVPRALDLWKQVLAQDPQNLNAIEGLEAQLETEDYAMAASEVLEPLYVEQGIPSRLVRLLEIRLRNTHDSASRRALYERIATLHESDLESPADAVSVLTRAAEEFLGEAELLDRLEGLVAQLGAWASLGDTLEALSDEAMDPAVRRGTLVRVARIREQELGDAGAAAGLWRRVLDEQPDDAEALNALERLDESLGEWPELIDVLVRKAELPDNAQDEARWKPLLFRAARLHEEELGQLDEAIEVMRGVLMRKPDDRDAVEQLERLFTATSRWEDLVENTERKLSLVEDPHEQRGLHFALGRVLENELEDADRATDAYRRALDLDPADLEALAALDRLYQQTENWVELLGVLERQAELVDVPNESRNIRFRIGRLQESELMNTAAALQTYRGILAEDASHEPTRAALAAMIDRGDEPLGAAETLEPIYRAEERWSELIAVNETRVEHAVTPEQRRDLFIDTAQIRERHLVDAGGALQSWFAAAREGARESELNEIERLSPVEDAWADVAALYGELWDDAVEPAMRTAIGLRLCRVLEEELGDIDAAIDAYGRLLEEDPGVQPALDALDRLYSARNAADELADVLQRRLLVGGAANDATQLRLRLGALQAGVLDQPADAVQTYRDVLAEDAGNERALSALEAMAADGVELFDVALLLEPVFREQQAWDRLVGLNETRIAHEDSDDERHRLWLDVADIREHQQDDAVGAMLAVGRALAARPSDVALLDRIEALAGPADAWMSVGTLYGSLLEEDFGDAEQLAIATRRARVLQERLGDEEQAESAWRRALAIEPESIEALKALDGITSRQERWHDNVEFVGRLQEISFDPTEQIALAFRKAETWRDRIGDSERARVAFHDVLEIDPTHRPSLDALLALYRAEERWSELFDTYEQVQSVVTDDAERNDIARDMARLAGDRLDRPMDAIDLWQSITLTQPEDREALQALEGLFQRTEQHVELVEVLDRQVALADDLEAKAQLLARSADLWASVLDNPDMAIRRYRELLELTPGAPAALHALRALYEQVSDFEPLTDVLRQLLDLGEIAPENEASVYEQLGTIYADTLLRPADAIAAWKAVRVRRPDDIEPLDRLEALYEAQEQWEPLIEVLSGKAELSNDDGERIELLKRCARLYADALQSPEKAAETYEKVLDIDLTDIDASTALESIYEASGEWEALAGLLLDRLDVVEDSWERLELLRRAAKLYEEQLGRPDGAYLIMSRASGEVPLDEEVRKELERLAALGDRQEELVHHYRALIEQVAASDGEEETLPLLLAVGRLQDIDLERPEMAEVYYDKALTFDPENETALKALESIYERTEDWESLVGVLKRLAALSYDVGEQVALYARAGALLESPIGDIPESIEAYKMGLRIDDTHAPTLSALERIYEEHGYWRELIDVLDRRAETNYDPKDLVPLRLRIAAVWRDHIGDAERAVDAFTEVTDVAPENAEALDALEALYADLGKWDRFLEVLDSRLVSATESSERIRIHAAQALVYESQFDDIDRAVDALNEVLLLDPAHLETIQTLERVFTDQERLPELIETLERHVDAVPAVTDKCAVLMRMAETQIDQLDDVPRAIETYSRVLEFDAGHADALQRLSALYESEERYPEAIASYDRLASVVTEPEQRLRLLLRVGRLLEDKQGDLEQAEDRFRQALAVDEAFLPAMEGLERLYRVQARWEELVACLQEQIEFRRDLRERAACMVRMAHVYRDELDDRGRAQHLYEEAIALDDQNTEAARALIELFFAAEDWVRCKPLLELVLADEDALEAEERVEMFTRQGVVDDELGYHDVATRSFEQALQLKPDHLPAQLGVARGYARRGDREEAFRVTMEILAQHRDAMEPAAAVDCYFQAGELKQQLGDLATARSMFENAVDLDPNHGPSLRRVLAIATEQGDQRGMVQAQRSLLRTVSDPQERFKLLLDIGDAHKELGATDAAEEAYREAVSIDASSKIVLNRLLNIFMETGNWRRATEVLGQLVRIEEDAERKAKLCFAIAAIFRDELGEKDEAVTFFNQALDAKFDHLEAFEAIDHLLTAARDWQSLERNYRRMLERVQEHGTDEHTALKVTLLKNLGEIYRSRMQEHDKAVAAYDLASSLAPDDEMLLTILTELLERSDSDPAKVIAAHKRLIAASWSRLDSYRALYKAYARAGETDKAWLMASALNFLNKATAEEEAFYKEGLKGQLLATNVTLTGDHWRLLAHPELDGELTQIFETIAATLRPEFARDLKRNWNVSKRQDRVSEELALVKMVQYVTRVLGTGEITVYEKAEYKGLLNANTEPMALIAGQDMKHVTSQRELAFRVAKAVALMLPSFYMASAFPDTNFLKVFFFAAFAVVTGQIADPSNEEAIKRYAYEIQDLPEVQRKRIIDAMRSMTEAGRNPDLSAWLRHVDETANRVGLLFCGDLRAAVTVVRNETLKIGKATSKEKAKALILFSISDEYAELRRALGFQVGRRR